MITSSKKGDLIKYKNDSETWQEFVSESIGISLKSNNLSRGYNFKMYATKATEEEYEIIIDENFKVYDGIYFKIKNSLGKYTKWDTLGGYNGRTLGWMNGIYPSMIIALKKDNSIKKEPRFKNRQYVPYPYGY